MAELSQGLDQDSSLPDDDFSPKRLIQLFEKLLREGQNISSAIVISNSEDDEGNEEKIIKW